MKSIGGYFGLELQNKGTVYHDNALSLNTGRNAFEHVLSVNKVEHIHIPYFTCEVMLEPLRKLGILYSFYSIDENFIPILKHDIKNHYILVTNYFGITSNSVRSFLKHTINIIVDNAQAFYEFPFRNELTIYSPRKFFGVPDGGFAYAENKKYAKDYSFHRFEHLLKRIDCSPEEGYEMYRKNDERLQGLPIQSMSNITHRILNSINYLDLKLKRLANFNYLHQRLNQINRLSNYINKAHFSAPLVYPLWVKNGYELRQELHEKNIYTATYWPNVLEWTKKDSIEYEYTNNIVHLPIDHRYGLSDMKEILNIIKV